MSTTGIVRRIDDLGRIVIPKEIRKTLRIKEGETLEIEVINDNIILKKFSNVNDIKSLLGILTDIFSKIIKKNILVFDRDRVICSVGDSVNNYLNSNISDYLYKLMESRKNNYIGDGKIEIVNDKYLTGNYIFTTIMPNGDVSGGILIFSDSEINDQDKLFLKIIEETLIKYIEE